MAEYTRKGAREWAWERMVGVANVIIPTYTSDLARLNERAIRYDVNKEIEYGFWGALLVSEAGTTLEEYIRFVEWAVDEARGRLRLIHHASFNTLEENIRAVQLAERAGVDLALLSYPPTFYPDSLEDIYEYTVTFCRSTNLGVILFPVPLWGFERLHPAGMPVELIKRIVEDAENVVAVKAEGGMPTIGGFVETYLELGKKVIVTCPLEWDGLALGLLVPIQFMGTSNYEYYGPVIPQVFTLVREGKAREAMKLYWQIHPARMANMAATRSVEGANFLHRMMWKYQGWLSGFNGGPLRLPTMRLVDRQMRQLREAHRASGLPTTPDPDGEFFRGRNPE